MGNASSNWNNPQNWSSGSELNAADIPDLKTPIKNPSSEVQLFPNPTPGETMLVLDRIAEESIVVEVFNQLGQRIKMLQEFNVPGHPLKLDLTEQSDGLYIIKVLAGEKTYPVEKLVLKKR